MADRAWQRVLDSYSIDEIAGGTTIKMPWRDFETKQTYVYDKEIKGTGLSSYALAKFYSGEWKPSEKTISKIVNFKNRERYNALVASGMSRKEARAVSRLKDSEKILHEMRKTVTTIAKNRGVDPAIIAASMQHSTRTSADWDYYTKEMDYDEPDEYPEDLEDFNEFLTEEDSWEDV